MVGTIGQPRALAAIEFGLAVETFDYNLLVAGAPGSGRLTAVRDYLERFALREPSPDDWVFVNFADPDRPKTIALPTGHASRLAHDMDELLRASRREVRSQATLKSGFTPMRCLAEGGSLIVSDTEAPNDNPRLPLRNR